MKKNIKVINFGEGNDSHTPICLSDIIHTIVFHDKIRKAKTEDRVISNHERDAEPKLRGFKTMKKNN